jgi:hypothetical protein
LIHLLTSILALTIFTAEKPAETRPKTEIAVFKGRFDNIENVLNHYRIKFTAYQYKDIENPEIYEKHSVIFFPCGIETPYEEKIKVNAQGRVIMGVSLSETFFEHNPDTVSALIKKFIEDGGSAYFSGYSFEFLKAAYDPFSYYYDFPNLGIPGRYEADLSEDLFYFSLIKKMAVYMDHTGWIVIKPSGPFTLLAETTANTPRGPKAALVSAILARGKGEILYTSYHESIHSEFRRFNVYRTIGSRTVKPLTAEAAKWAQSVNSTIVDALHAGEPGRLYAVNLRSGKNTLYFSADTGAYQIDMYDKKMRLLFSIDRFQSAYTVDFESDGGDTAFLKVLPADTRRYNIYSIVSASGSRTIPHLKKIMLWSAIPGGLILLYLFLRIFHGRRYGGRI